MIQRLTERLTRLEQTHAQRSGYGDSAIPPGMTAVLMYGIAVHLGGFPGPMGVRGPYLADTVGDAFARGLGCADESDLQLLAERSDKWAERFEGAVSRLLCRLGLAEAEVGSPDAFRAFVRMLDEFALAKTTGGMARGWDGIGDSLDDWILSMGYSPEVIRSEVRQ